MIVPQHQHQLHTDFNSLGAASYDMPSTSDILISQTIEPETNSTHNPHSSSHQINPTDAGAKAIEPAISLSSTMNDVTTTTDCNSCSIELFDTPPSPLINSTHGEGPDQAEEFPQKTGQQHSETEAQQNKSMRELLQQQYNQYYQNYQQHQNMNKSNADSSCNTSQEASNASQFNSSILSGDDVSTIAESAADYRPPATPSSAPASATATADNNNVNVPISHLMAGNEYPSFHRRPPTAILQSFTPIYNPPAQQPQTGNDIYQEYVQNPYNLTLQPNQSTVTPSLVSVEQHQRNLHQLQQQYQQHTQQQLQQQQQQQPTVPSEAPNHRETFNSPANYFTSTVDVNSIPPGSEMLFGQP